MMSFSTRFTGPFVMWMAFLSFLVATGCMINRLEPFYTWYYVFSWWSYIVFLEGLLHWKGGKSALFGSISRFFLQMPLSITIWLIFEVFNFRLQNWHYVQVPSSLLLRWLGYAVSFATVLPGLNATTGLVRHLAVFSSVRWPSFDLRKGTQRCIMGAGVLSLILPIVWPQFFFSLVWLGFILLLAPLPRCARPKGLLQSIQSGRPRELLELLLSGMICGLLWELWNYWAGAKWVYTVPFVGWLKIFEMPLLGFLGFPPFAVECYLMSGCALHFWDSIGSNQNPRTRWSMRCLLGLALLVFWVLVFTGIDRNTVISFGV